jgi:hypothetical protein
LDGSEKMVDGYEEGWCVDLWRGRAYQVCKVWGGATASSNLGRRRNGGRVCRWLAKPVRSLGQAFTPPQWKEGRDRRRAGEMGMEGRGAEDGGSKRLRWEGEGECRARAQERSGGGGGRR